jgi:hypothetical protein
MSSLRPPIETTMPTPLKKKIRVSNVFSETTYRNHHALALKEEDKSVPSRAQQ